METTSKSNIHIKIEKFLSTWWVKSFKKNEGDLGEKFCDKGSSKKFKVVNSYVFLKWIIEEISKFEKDDGLSCGGKKEKVYLKIKSEEELINVAALTPRIKTMLQGNADRPELKEELLKNETFTKDSPYWPSRWFLEIKISMNQIPPFVWNLQNVEILDIAPDGYDRIRYDSDRKLNLSPRIGTFKHLKYLNLELSYLKSLPVGLKFCEKLTILKLRNNDLTTLPYFITTLPNLTVLTRQNNSFDFEAHRETMITPPLIPTQLDVNKIEQTRSCNSLKHLALERLCKLDWVTISNLHTLNIPSNLKIRLYELLGKYCICDYCNIGGFNMDQAYKCRIVLDDFRGYKMIPFTGYTCSLQCAEQLAQTMNEKNEDFDSTVPVYVNEDAVYVTRRPHIIYRSLFQRLLDRILRRDPYGCFKR